MLTSRKERIEQSIQANLSPAYMEVIDESAKHNVPINAQSHFKVVVASPLFENKSLIERHRHINQLIQDEFNHGLHALAIHAYTPIEWERRQHQSSPSPQCRGGSKHDTFKH